jgi:hypothetical protein
MAAPRGSFSRPFTRVEPTRVPKEPVLAVGWDVLVRAAGGSSDRVSLTDEDGVTALATVKPGVEVEITAWRPRRAGPALYRVRTKDGRKEGWVSATHLEHRPKPPVPKPVRSVTSVPGPGAKRVAAKTPKRPQKGARAR